MSIMSPLLPEDDLFGRVAIHNKLVTGEQVEECTGFIVAELARDRPRRSLASTLIGKGHISAMAAAAVQKAVNDYAAKHFGKAAPAPGAPPEPKPILHPVPAGMSQKIPPIKDAAPKTDNRFRLEAPDGSKTAVLTVECHRLYAADGPAVEAACHRLLATDRSDLRLDMRLVENIPSVIIGVIGNCADEARQAKRDLLLICSKSCAKMVKLVVGNQLRIKTGKAPIDGGMRLR